MPTRRDFQKTAVGTALVSGSTGAASNTPGPQAYGVGPVHGYAGGQGLMMYMPGHSMIGARTEPPGALADDEVSSI